MHKDKRISNIAHKVLIHPMGYDMDQPDNKDFLGKYNSQRELYNAVCEE